MENWVRGWDCRWVSSFNILLIKDWPGGDIEQVIPIGSWEPPVPPSLEDAGAVLRECTRLSRQRGDWVRRPGEGSAAGQLVDSLFPACGWPPTRLSELLSWCYWTLWVSVLWATWSQQQQLEEQGLLFVLFCIWNLNIDFHSVAVWTHTLRAQQLCPADALSLQKGLILMACGGKPGFGVRVGGTETWDNTGYMAVFTWLWRLKHCSHHIPMSEKNCSSNPQTLEMMFKP